MKTVYLTFAILGAVIPYSQLLPWLFEHGLDLHLLIRQLFANRISSFFALDLLLSAVVLLTFIRRRGTQTSTPHLWLPILATLTIGVSCGLPLFLWLQERHTSLPMSSTTAETP